MDVYLLEEKVQATLYSQYQLKVIFTAVDTRCPPINVPLLCQSPGQLNLAINFNDQHYSGSGTTTVEIDNVEILLGSQVAVNFGNKTTGNIAVTYVSPLIIDTSTNQPEPLFIGLGIQLKRPACPHWCPPACKCC